MYAPGRRIRDPEARLPCQNRGTGTGHETPRPCSVRGPSCAGNPHHPGSSECGPSFERGRSPKEPDRRCSVGHTSQADEAPATVKRSVLAQIPNTVSISPTGQEPPGGRMNLSQCGPCSQPEATNVTELIEQSKKRFRRIFPSHGLE